MTTHIIPISKRVVRGFFWLPLNTSKTEMHCWRYLNAKLNNQLSQDLRWGSFDIFAVCMALFASKDFLTTMHLCLGVQGSVFVFFGARYTEKSKATYFEIGIYSLPGIGIVKTNPSSSVTPAMMSMLSICCFSYSTLGSSVKRQKKIAHACKTFVIWSCLLGILFLTQSWEIMTL